MTRKITTAAELDALPVGSVVLGADHPAQPRRALGERISASWDPDARWGVDGRHYYGAAETVLAVLGGAATVLYDPSATAPSVVPEAAVEAATNAVRRSREFSAGAAFGIPLDAIGTAASAIAHAALTAALPHLTVAPSEVERIARALTETTALTGADALRIVQAAQAMSAPSATREEVRDEIAGHPIGSGYYATSVGVDEASEIADALLARFNITPKGDR